MLQSDPFAFTKDSASGPASITTATSLAVHSAERGEGCAIIIFPRKFGGFSESAFVGDASTIIGDGSTIDSLDDD